MCVFYASVSFKKYRMKLEQLEIIHGCSNSTSFSKEKCRHQHSQPESLCNRTTENTADNWWKKKSFMMSYISKCWRECRLQTWRNWARKGKSGPRKHTSDVISHKDNPVCIERVAEERIWCLTRSGAVYTLLDVRESCSQSSKLMRAVIRYTKLCSRKKLHGLLWTGGVPSTAWSSPATTDISFSFSLLDGQVEFLVQLDPHQPQPIFPSVSAC